MSSDNKELTVMTGIERTVQWFEQAIPEPTVETACVQIGCAYEETAELADTLNDVGTSCELRSLAWTYKSKEVACISEILQLSEDDKIQMLDDIVDEIVTRIGIAHNMGFDILGALAEVNRSNFSKFEDGEPVFDVNGKITKGKCYTPPNLTPFI